METNELYLKAAFCCMACDGSIVEEETNLLKKKVQNSELFSGIDIENTLNGYVDSINLVGSSFLGSFLEELKQAELNEEEQLNILGIAIEVIEADNEIKYSEIKFFKRIRSLLSIGDEAILAKYPDKEDYLLPDISQDEYEFLPNASFAAFSVLS